MIISLSGLSTCHIKEYERPARKQRAGRQISITINPVRPEASRVSEMMKHVL